MRGENVGNGQVDWKDTKYLSNKSANNFDEYNLVEGDVIIGMDRTFTKQGCRISILTSNDVPCLLVQRVGRFIPISVTKKYLELIVNSNLYHQQLLINQKGMDIPHLSKSEILSVHVPIADTNEQKMIGQLYNSLDSTHSCYEELLGKISLLKTALMHDLLTGKVRVTELLNQT